ncbi:hypothetical protein, partial [Klebsiella variicola]|uniref:hypothetical protein n=1 Tax=Klebsiella variicola TaxID=244366 RepID=UPI002731760C
GTLIERTKRASIPHNKFIVKVRDGEAISVWTGSTNFSQSGFIGQANTGHLVRDKAVAASVLAYWEMLSTNPVPDDFKAWTSEHSPNPGA